MRVHFVVHEAFEAPGAIETWAIERGHSITYSRVYLGESLPSSLDAIDFLIVMGGPQSPNTTVDECPHFDSNSEQQLIVKAIGIGKAVLGVCLGSQLIGEALGAPFEHSPEKEVGKFSIYLTKEGSEDPLFSQFGSQLEVGHWHGDMPGLTPSAKVLAYSEGCPRQIIRYQDLVYGFQCHMEFTAEVIELLITNSASDIEDADNAKFIQDARTLREHEYSDMNKRLYSFLDAVNARFARLQG